MALDDRERERRRKAVWAAVRAIPAGAVATYGEVAGVAGLPGRARWVGRVLRELPPGSDVPWFRVVAAGGRIALRDEDARRQSRCLRAEGVEVTGRRIDLRRFGIGEGGQARGRTA